MTTAINVTPNVLAIAPEKVLAAADEAMVECKAAMLVYYPFTASFLMDVLKLKWSLALPTAGTNGVCIWINPLFFTQLPLIERITLLNHEIGHCMFDHMDRGKFYADTIGPDGTPFDHRVWNEAADYVINDMLVQNKLGRLPAGALHLPREFPFSMAVDDVYRTLKARLPPPPPPCGGGQGQSPPAPSPGQGQGSGQGQPQPKPEGTTPNATVTSETTTGRSTMDTHIYETPEKELAPETRKRALITAQEAARSQGMLPAGLERIVEKLVHPQVPWQDLLRFAVSKKLGKGGRSMSRINRRALLLRGVILPGRVGYRTGTIAVCIDTSGSIGGKILTTFMSELHAILEDCHPELVYVIECDAAIGRVSEIEDELEVEDLMKTMTGGGGTSFIPPFEYLSEQGVQPDLLVYLTDMFGSFPENAPSYPVLWCSITKDRIGPFGETIHIEVKD